MVHRIIWAFGSSLYDIKTETFDPFTNEPKQISFNLFFSASCIAFIVILVWLLCILKGVHRIKCLSQTSLGALCEPWIRFQCKKLIIIHSSVVLGSRPGSLHGLSPIQYNHSPHTIQCLGESYLTARLFTSRRSSRPAATTPEESNKAVSRTLKSTFKVRGSLCRDLGTVCPDIMMFYFLKIHFPTWALLCNLAKIWHQNKILMKWPWNLRILFQFKQYVTQMVKIVGFFHKRDSIRRNSALKQIQKHAFLYCFQIQGITASLDFTLNPLIFHTTEQITQGPERSLYSDFTITHKPSELLFKYYLWRFQHLISVFTESSVHWTANLSWYESLYLLGASVGCYL